MRWLMRVLMAVIVLALLAGTAVLLLPGEKIASFVETRFAAATGRTLSLGGGVRATLYPVLGVRMGAVEVANADWSKAGPMLSAAGLRVGVALLPLLRGEVRIKRVELIAPKILLEKSADGRTNWDFGPPSGAKTAPTAATGGAAIPAFSLDLGVIENATLTYVDDASGLRQKLTDVNARLRLPDFAGPAQVTLSARLNGQPLALSGNVAGFGGLLGGAVSPVVVRLSTGGSSVAFDGRLRLAPITADGSLIADLADMPALFAALGQSAPDLPKGLGQSAKITGQLIYPGQGSIHLRDGVIVSGPNRLRGTVDLSLKARPRLKATLTTTGLDLSGLRGAGTGAAPANGGGAPQGWSKTRIDVSGLSALDADISLSADRVTVAGAKLGKTRVTATLKRGRAVVDLREMRAYDGLISGQVVVNGRGGLSVSATLQAAKIAMQPLLRDTLGYGRLIGRGDVSLSLLGAGSSIDAIARSLSGKGTLKLGRGELQGLDLVGMLRNLSTSYQGKGARTIFDAISASFTVKNGVLQNDDLLFKAPLATATGKGSVDIGAQTLNYRVTPVALAASDGSGGISVPVIISGPWAALKFRPDLAALATGGLGGGLGGNLGASREALKKRVEGAVAKSLGAPAQPGTQLSPKDALKRKLEDEAKRGLLNLLGGAGSGGN